MLKAKNSIQQNEGKQRKLSYKERLDNVSRIRYDEKLTMINKTDPYELKQADLSTDENLLPDLGHTDIINYLVFTPSPYTANDLKAYKSLQAYNQFVCGWVSGVCTLIINGKHLIKARVMHSQRMREKPLSPWIITEKNGTVLASHCDCMAGIGETCTHVAALLFYIDTAVRLRNSRTVTQEKAYWLLPSAVKTASYNETSEIDFSSAKTLKRKLDASIDNANSHDKLKKARKCTPEPSEKEKADFFKSLSELGRKPAILTIMKEYSDSYVPKTKKLPVKLSALKDHNSINMNYMDLVQKCSDISISASEEEVANVEKLTRRQSNSKQWFDFRAGRITASNMKGAFTTDPSNPSQSLIKKICYPSNLFQNEATKWGKEHEVQARSEFLFQYQEHHDNARIIDNGLYISSERPFIAASPDGILSCNCCAKSCVEVKCPFSKKDQMINEDIPYLKRDSDGILRLDTTHDYYFQIQCQMGCTGLKSSYFVVWTSVDCHVEQIDFNDNLWKLMCEKAEIIFRIGILPELVGKFYTKPSVPKLPTNESTEETHHKKPILQQINSQPQGLKDRSITSPLKSTNETTNCNEERWCYCDQVEFGEMICCDNENCEIRWFHFPCLKITRKPKSKLWYCPDCRKLKK